MKKIFYICVILTIMLLAGCVSKPSYDNDELINLSPKEEPKLAKSLHKHLLKENPLYKDKSLTKYINRIGRKLANQIEDNKIKIKFFISDTSNYRALAIPGGYVHITRGMLAALNNEDELAMVLGHEIAHIINRDYKLDSKIKNEIQLPGNRSEIKTYFEENKDLLERYTQFNFEREFEADKIALELAHAAGYDVFRGINTLRAIKNHDRYFGYATEGYSSYTHPEFEKRISKLYLYAKELPEPIRKAESNSDIYLKKN